ncbi:MAG: phosphate signaling complex protein PhoU [Bacilli bacterium]|jgi:phosphate transport system protein
MLSSFQEYAKKMELLLDQMVQAVSGMHQDAMEALRKQDRDLAMSIFKRDNEVNEIDEAINNLALEMLATQGPVASDLRKVIATVRAATDIERIGDYAKKAAEYVVLGQTLEPEIGKYIFQMAAVFQNMFLLAYSALKDKNVQQAYEVAQIDRQIDDLTKLAFAELPNVLASTNDLLKVLYTFNMIRTYERAGDHTKNVCESVIFLAKGKKIDIG